MAVEIAILRKKLRRLFMMVLFDSLQLNLTHSLESASHEMLNEAHHLIPES